MNNATSEQGTDIRELEIERLKKQIEMLEKTVHSLNHTLSMVLKRYIA